MSETKTATATESPYVFGGSLDAMVAGRQFDMPLMRGGDLVTLATIAEIAQGLDGNKYHKSLMPVMEHTVTWFKAAGTILGDPNERKKFPGFGPDPESVQRLAFYLSTKAIEKDAMTVVDEYISKQKAQYKESLGKSGVSM